MNRLALWLLKTFCSNTLSKFIFVISNAWYKAPFGRHLFHMKPWVCYLQEVSSLMMKAILKKWTNKQTWHSPPLLSFAAPKVLRVVVNLSIDWGECWNLNSITIELLPQLKGIDSLSLRCQKFENFNYCNTVKCEWNQQPEICYLETHFMRTNFAWNLGLLGSISFGRLIVPVQHPSCFTRSFYCQNIVNIKLIV